MVRDADFDGTYDTGLELGVEGITVTLRDDAGNSRTATTNAQGVASFPPADAPLAGGKYRAEATIPDSMSYLQPTIAGGPAPALSSLVSFVDVTGGKTASVVMGVANPADYSPPDPTLITPRHLGGWRTGGNPGDAAVVTYPWSRRGSVDAFPSPRPATLATYGDVGTTYGIAVQRSTQRVFAGALAKRHTAYGPNGPGAIYVGTPGAGGGYTWSLFANLPNAGATAHGANYAQDPGFFNPPGKESLGDLEMSEDDSTLYAVNVASKQLVSIPVGAAGAVTSVPIPDPGCTVATDWRPFGLGVRDGVVYVGGVCSAESSQLRADMRAVVYAYQNGSFGTPVVDHRLDFPRGSSGPALGPGTWNPWLSTWDTSKIIGPAAAGGTVMYPQPILSDIAFDRDGDMILGFRDRFADQVGLQSLSNPDTPGVVYSTFSNGDINRVCLEDGAYVWEGEGGCADNYQGGPYGGPELPGTREYYPGEVYTFDGAGGHEEMAQGALWLAPRFTDVATTALDPVIDSISGGVLYLHNDDGRSNTDQTRGYVIYRDDPTNPAAFGKANGLGDLEALVTPGPAQIGNQVWYDADRDGIQDPSEPALPGVVCTLRAPNGSTTSTTTNAMGEYYFMVQPGLQYTVTCDPSGATNLPAGVTATDLEVTKKDGGADNIDSDADDNGTVVVTAPAAGTANHTYDIGFMTPPRPGIALDKTRDEPVDVNQNGITDVGDTVVYHYKVTNTGNVPLTDVNVTDDKVTGITCEKTTLAPAESTNCTSPPYTFTQADADAGEVVNTAIAHGTPPDGPPIDTPPDEERVPLEKKPAITLVKTHDTPVDVNDNDITDAGDTVVYNYEVKNTGNVTLTNVNVTDDKATGITCAATTLAPGASTTCKSAPYTFTEADAEAGQVKNTAVAHGTPPGDEPPIDSPPDDDIVPLQELVSVGDFVWFDTDGDGQQDQGEPGLGNVTVTLRDEAGNPVGEPKNTTPDGKYLFEDLLPDTKYRICFDPKAATGLPEGVTPADLEPTAINVDGDGTDSDINAEQCVDITTPATGENLTFDAGYKEKPEPTVVSIGDKVWYDADRDGVQDQGEPGIQGVKVTLQNPDGTLAKPPATTDSNGHYAFNDLPANTEFKLCFDKSSASNLPAGLQPGHLVPTAQNADNDDAADSDIDPTSQCVVVTTPATGNDPTFDAGYMAPEPSPTVNIGDYVWVDTNKNGIQDPGEPPLQGVTVTLKYEDGTTKTVTTDDRGIYRFEGVKPETPVQVCFDPSTVTNPPAGVKLADLKPTGVNSDGDDTRDSDIDQGGCVALTTPAPGQDDLTVDAGYVTPTLVTIGDQTWLDQDGDGVQDPNEPALQGVTVTLKDADGKTVGETSTDENGNYVFENLPADTTFEVCFDASNAANLPEGVTADMLQPTRSNVGDNTKDSDIMANGCVEVTTPESGEDPTIDAGFDTKPAPHAELKLDKQKGEPEDVNGNGRTDAGDRVSYTYLVTNTGDVELSEIEVADDKIGPVTCPATALAPGESVTCEAGPYTITPEDAAAGEVKNTAVATGTTPDGEPVESNEDTETVPVEKPVSIGDKAWIDEDGDGIQDPNEPPLQGVTVTIKNPDGTVVDTSTTDSKGEYKFDNLLPNTGYEVCFDASKATGLPEGVTAAALNPTRLNADGDDAKDSDIDENGCVTVTTPSQGANNTVDGGYVLLNPAIDLVKKADKVEDVNGNGRKDAGDKITYSYEVTNMGNVPLTEVKVTDNKIPTVTCDKTALAPGEKVICTGGPYTVTAEDVKAGKVHNTATATGVDPNGEEVPSEPSEVEVPLDPAKPLLVLDKKKDEVEDVNGNGLTDAGDKVTYSYELSNTGDVKVTDIQVTDDKIANVSCPKAELAPGEKVTCTGGPYTITEADATAGKVVNTAVAKGKGPEGEPVESEPDTEEVPVDKTVTIGDKVWLDNNKNGVQDDGEPPLKDVTVTLKDKDGNVVQTTKTDPEGKYEFTVKPETEYEVCFDASTATGLPDGVTAADLKPTGKDAGEDDAKDSDADANGCVKITSPAEDGDDTIDAGFATPPRAHLTVDKKADKVDDTNHNGRTDAGDKVTYTYVVKNDGDVKVTDIKVTDNKIANVSCPKTELAPGESMTCTGGPYTITAADANAGEVMNTAVATGKDPDGKPVKSDEDKERVPVHKPVQVVVVKPKPEPVSPPSGKLPVTGASALTVGAGGILLLVGGGVMMLIARRRRTSVEEG
ncbi:SdrD B-like domain-containing protein [Phytohabitans sp. ZYX-F-186]|uniref:SdrD B-like domain-containing protein n=1 Tax=Phytohabitans maris TaxID=3071409 RepID=A0ABU0ZVD3_9ACTN|nr:SdrD B-like domain-containing protein [Phytohabitans sp. ZYX-F-186]MDQ7910998.1 SdrD B-like domain-containing protein [Phytohabitans sp. ZYX-F-186]